jgi:hypothetical protein
MATPDAQPRKLLTQTLSELCGLLFRRSWWEASDARPVQASQKTAKSLSKSLEMTVLVFLLLFRIEWLTGTKETGQIASQGAD